MEKIEKLKPEKFESEIIETNFLSEDVKHLVLSVPNEFKFIPGQYISVILEKDGKKIRRPYSICSSPNHKNKIELCIKIVENGIATPIISKLNIGNKLEVLGPLGEFMIDEKSKDKNIVFISNGSGIGPFKSMIPWILENGFENGINLIGGYKEIPLYDKEFKDLEKKFPNFNYKVALSSQGRRVQDILKTDKDSHYYLCGLKEMINSVRAILVKNGVEMSNIFSEKYD